MTRRDYVLLEETIKLCIEIVQTESEREGIRFLARLLASRLALENRAFDQKRFLKDAGATK